MAWHAIPPQKAEPHSRTESFDVIESMRRPPPVPRHRPAPEEKPRPRPRRGIRPRADSRKRRTTDSLATDSSMRIARKAHERNTPAGSLSQACFFDRGRYARPRYSKPSSSIVLRTSSSDTSPSTAAVPAARSTSTVVTEGSDARLRSTLALQWLQLMPPTR